MSDAKRQASRSAKLEKRLQAWNHDLEILYSVHLQWVFINARASHAFSKQKAEAEQQLYAATQAVAKLREEVRREQALLEGIKYDLHLEDVVNAQYACMPLLEDSIVKISPAYSELSTAIEATTHRLPTTGIIVPPPAELNQALIEAEETMDDILEAVGSQLGALSEYSRSTEGLVAVLGEELKELKTTKELLVETDMLESQRRSLLIQYIQEHGHRPDE